MGGGHDLEIETLPRMEGPASIQFLLRVRQSWVRGVCFPWHSWTSCANCKRGWLAWGRGAEPDGSFHQITTQLDWYMDTVCPPPHTHKSQPSLPPGNLLLLLHVTHITEGQALLLLHLQCELRKNTHWPGWRHGSGAESPLGIHPVLLTEVN